MVDGVASAAEGVLVGGEADHGVIVRSEVDHGQLVVGAPWWRFWWRTGSS